jgi:hypothetical protein
MDGREGESVFETGLFLEEAMMSTEWKWRDPGTEPCRKHSDQDEINAMFKTLLARDLGSFAGFVENVHGFWEEFGYLTDRQYQAIRRAAR